MQKAGLVHRREGSRKNQCVCLEGLDGARPPPELVLLGQPLSDLTHQALERSLQGEDTDGCIIAVSVALVDCQSA